MLLWEKKSLLTAYLVRFLKKGKNKDYIWRITFIPFRTSFRSLIRLDFSDKMTLWYFCWSFPKKMLSTVMTMITATLPNVATPIWFQIRYNPAPNVTKKERISYWNMKASWILWQSTDIRFTMSPIVYWFFAALLIVRDWKLINVYLYS